MRYLYKTRYNNYKEMHTTRRYTPEQAYNLFREGLARQVKRPPRNMPKMSYKPSQELLGPSIPIMQENWHLCPVCKRNSTVNRFKCSECLKVSVNEDWMTH